MESETILRAQIRASARLDFQQNAKREELVTKGRLRIYPLLVCCLVSFTGCRVSWNSLRSVNGTTVSSPKAVCGIVSAENISDGALVRPTGKIAGYHEIFLLESCIDRDHFVELQLDSL